MIPAGVLAGARQTNITISIINARDNLGHNIP
jgi:hypothetical protein